jgi:hypothetical protein
MRPCVSTSFDHPSIRFATRSHMHSANKHSPPIAVNAEHEEFCSFLPFCLASIALTPNESGQDGANVGRCFSLRLIIPVLIAGHCFGFIPGTRVTKQIYSKLATHDAVSSGELTSDPSYLDCSD